MRVGLQVRISEIELSGARVLENGPTIVVTFSVQQIHCIRDKTGELIFYRWSACDAGWMQGKSWMVVRMIFVGCSIRGPSSLMIWHMI